MARIGAVIALLVLPSIMLSGFAQSPHVAEERQQDSSWNIMVYMADDFFSSLNWQEDFNEMEAAMQAPGTNIIALVDPYGPGNSALYKVEHDPNLLDPTLVSDTIWDDGAVIPGGSGGEVNMAEGSTLSSFIEFSVSLHPAAKNVLVLWGHGAGWRGLCPDGTDLLTMPELSDALSDAVTTIGGLLDLVVVDSCAEATLEIFWEIRGSARLFAGSENSVPFQGLPYDIIMNDLAAEPTKSIDEFAENVVDDYVIWSSTNTDYSVTMGVFNLSKIEPLVMALDALSAQGQKYDPIFHDVLRTAFNESESYEEPECVDFGNFMWELQKADLPLEIRYCAFESLLKGRDVIQHFSKHDLPSPVNGVHVRNASAFTIFAPGVSAGDEEYDSISLATSQWLGFGRLLRNDTNMTPNGPGPIVSLTSSTVNLTWQEGTDSCSIWVFMDTSNGLAYESSETVDGSAVSLSVVPGFMTLATSSYVDGSLDSYKTVKVFQDGNVSITVQVILDGQPVNNLFDRYEVSLIASDNERLLSTQPPQTGTDGSCLIQLQIPEDASIGDIVTVQIAEKSSGDVIATKKVFVPRHSMTVNVDVSSYCNCPYRIVVPLLFALLPGLLILGFALSLHLQNRKSKKNE